MESFLKVRSKNLAEEVRLSHMLQSLDLEKKQWEKESFNQHYEDQRMAFMMKRESKAIKMKKEMKKNKNSLEAHRKPPPPKPSAMEQAAATPYTSRKQRARPLQQSHPEDTVIEKVRPAPQGTSAATCAGPQRPRKAAKARETALSGADRGAKR